MPNRDGHAVHHWRAELAGAEHIYHTTFDSLAGPMGFIADKVQKVLEGKMEPVEREWPSDSKKKMSFACVSSFAMKHVECKYLLKVRFADLSPHSWAKPFPLESQPRLPKT